MATRVTPLAAGLLLGACKLVDNGSNDSTGGSTGDDGGPRTATIYEIQQGMIPEMTTVLLRDVVVTSPVNVTEGAVFVGEQDGGPFSGIYVFMFTEVVDGVELKVGDVVDVRGLYTEYFEFSEITVSNAADITVTSSTQPLAPTQVDPAMLAAGGQYGESFESVLVTVAGARVTESDAGFGQFEVAGGLLVDDWFLLEDGASPHPPVDTVFDAIVGPVLFEFEEFKIVPRTLDDFVGGPELGAQVRTIPEIQQGVVAEGSTVVVENVVVISPPTFEGDTFYVQDPSGGEYSGIAVYMFDAMGLGVTVGDRLTFEAQYAEYFGQSQLVIPDPSALETLGTGAMPAATLVMAADVATGGADQLAFEGVLVRVDDVTVTQAANMYGEWQVDGVLPVDDLFFATGWIEPAVDTAFASITGVMTYSFEVAKLAPTGPADLVEG